MKIAIFGGSGQLGRMLNLKATKAGHEVVSFSSKDVDIVELQEVDDVLPSDIDVVINCAAEHNLKLCEENPIEAFDTNTIGARNTAVISKQRNALNVYVSTNYVLNDYGLEKPLNVYGISKLAGEHMTATFSGKYVIARTAALYGPFPCSRKPGNFVDNILKRIQNGETEFTMVSDQYVNLSRTDCVAELLLQYVKDALLGEFPLNKTISAVNPQSYSWCEYAKLICEHFSNLLKIDIKVHPTYTDKSISPKRPFDASLFLTQKYCSFLPNSKEALLDYLKLRYQDGWIEPLKIVDGLKVK